MMTTEQLEFLNEEYDAVKVIGANTCECYIAYIDETHVVKAKGWQLWAFANDHSWLIN